MDLVRYEPDALLAKYRSIRASVSADVFYTKPEFRKVMELWCAAQFARGYAQNVKRCAVWISEGDQQLYFDFKLEIGQMMKHFQLTEVLTDGRRRGDEYRKGGPASRTTAADWDRGERLCGEWVASAIRRKHDHYAGDVADLDLLVYVNFVAVEHPYKELRDHAASDAARFRSVWLLNDNAIACIASRDEEHLMERAWMFFTEKEANEI